MNTRGKRSPLPPPTSSSTSASVLPTPPSSSSPTASLSTTEPLASGATEPALGGSQTAQISVTTSQQPPTQQSNIQMPAPPPTAISPAPSTTSVHSHSSHRSTQSSSQRQHRGNTGGAGTVSGEAGGLEEWRLEAVLASLLHLNDGRGRLLCPPFRVLPPESEFPSYYEQIKQPIDLRRIAQKIRAMGEGEGHASYRESWQPMEADVKLLVRNAKAFNERGSQIYSDAGRLQTHFMTKREEYSECRRPTARELAANRTLIDELLKQGEEEEDIGGEQGGGRGSSASGALRGAAAYSEDSEEDEDSEQDQDPRWRLYWRVRNHEVVNGEAMCEPFLELPSRRNYPDYYDEITEPMSLWMINKQLKSGKLPALSDVLRALLRMFTNACAYNMDGSGVFVAAVQLRDLASATAKELEPALDVEALRKEFDVGELAEKKKEKSSSPKKRTRKRARQPTPSPSETEENEESGGTLTTSAGAAVATERSRSGARATTASSASQHSATSTKAKQPRLLAVEKEEVDGDEEGAPLNIAPFPSLLGKPKPKEAPKPTPAPSASTTSTTAPATSSSSSPLAAPPPKKRGRPFGSKNKVPRVEEKLAQKPGRKSIEELKEKFGSRLREVWRIVSELKVGDRLLAEHFRYLPCDKTFPDYYTTITKPMSMECIKEKIEGTKYRDSNEMMVDISLMCANAREYNRPDSQIYIDSSILESVAKSTMSSLTEDQVMYFPVRKSDKEWTNETTSTIRSDLAAGRGRTSTKAGAAPGAQSPATPSQPAASKHPVSKREPKASPSPAPAAPVFHPPLPSAAVAGKSAVSASLIGSSHSHSPSPASSGSASAVMGVAHSIPRHLSKDQQQMHSVFEALLTHKEPGDERLLSEAFMKLPSRSDYPDYYKIIKKPMDLNQVRAKLNAGTYDSLRPMVADLNLVFDNACKFNEPDSQLYKDALTLQKELLNLKSQFIDPAAELGAAGGGIGGGGLSVQSEVRRILTNILSAIMTHKGAEGRCLSNSLSELPELLKRKAATDKSTSTPVSLLPLPPSLDEIKQNVDTGRYRRLDKFQEDLFLLFQTAREAAPTTESPLFTDSMELQALYLKKRDELCRNVLSSPASLYIHSQLMSEIEELRAKREKKRGRRPSTATAASTNVQASTDGEGEFNKTADDSANQDDKSQLAMKSEASEKEQGGVEAAGKMEGEQKEGESKVKEVVVADSNAMDTDETSLTLANYEERLDSIEVGGITYKPGDYVYVSGDTTSTKSSSSTGPSQTPARDHIMRITSIEPGEDEEDGLGGEGTGVALVHGMWCYRPHETYHRATKRFYANEVFLSNESDTVTADRLKGRCCVMPLEDWMKRRPLNFDESRDVFVCESRYLGRKLHFKKLTAWPYPEELENMEAEDRPEPIQPPERVLSEIAAKVESNTRGGIGGVVGGGDEDSLQSYDNVKSENADEAAGDVDDGEIERRRLTGRLNPLDITREEVLERRPWRELPQQAAAEEASGSGEGNSATASGEQVPVYYQQLEYRGKFYRLGDGVLVFREGKSHCDVMRIDRLWRTTSGEAFFSGSWFARPKETRHEASRMFYRREVIAVEQPDCVERLDSVQARCAILTVKQYETSRPTEIPECDIFVVDQKVPGKQATAGQTLTAKNCSLILTKHGEAASATALANALQFSSSTEGQESNDTASNVTSASTTSGNVVMAELNMEFAKPLRKLKAYNLLNAVVEDEIYYFKAPLTMERELSPQQFSSPPSLCGDTSLPIDQADLERERAHLEAEHRQLEHDEDSGSGAGGSGGASSREAALPKGAKDAQWLASQPKLNAKSKSGYILFSAEIRKRIMHENPESGFGEVSKIVGLEWKKLSDEEKRQYEVRAHVIADERAKADLLTPTSKLLQPGQIRVYFCRWQMCDFQFDSLDGLYEHIKGSHTCLIPQDPDGDQFVCLWTSCLKYRKEGKPFPSLPRLHRHLKEKHLPASSKAIFPNQKSKHYFAYMQPRSTSAASSSAGVAGDRSPTKSHHDSAGGLFIHQPYGVQPPSAVACSVATPTPSSSGSGPTVREAYGHSIAAAYHHQHAPQPSQQQQPMEQPPLHIIQQRQPQNGYSQHSAGTHTTQYILAAPPSSSMAGATPGGGHSTGAGVQQLVPHTLSNGTTVYIPAGSQSGQIQTAYVINQQTGTATPAGLVSTGPPHGGAQQHPTAQPIVVHHQQPPPSQGVATAQQYIQQQHQAAASGGEAGSGGHFVQIHSTSGIAAQQHQQQPTAVQMIQQPQQPQAGAAQHGQLIYRHAAPQTPQQQMGPSSSSYQIASHPAAVVSSASAQQQQHPHGQPQSYHQLQTMQQSAGHYPQSHHQQALAFDPGRTVVEASKRPEPVFVAPTNSVQQKRLAHSEIYLRYIESLYAGKRQVPGGRGGVVGSHPSGNVPHTPASSSHSNNSMRNSNSANNGVQLPAPQRTISKWEKSLAANQRNTPLPPSTAATTAATSNGVSSGSKRANPYEWIRAEAGGSKRREDEIVKALWRLREQLLQDTTDIQRGSSPAVNGSMNGT